MSDSVPKKAIGRRAKRSMETREKIFRCALGLFSERGFSATTIDAIAEAADIGKGTFFNYFANKESILVEYREMQMGRVRTFVAESMSSNVPLAPLFYQFALTMTAEQHKSPALFQSLLSAILANDLVQKRMAEGLRCSREMLAEFIAKRQESGEISTGIAAIELAHSFQRMVLGTSLIWSLSPETPLQDCLRDMVQLFIEGIKPRS